MGDIAERFFGVSGYELVYQYGFTDPTILPKVLPDKLSMTFKWRLGPHNMESFLVHSITPITTEDPSINIRTISEMQQQYAIVGGTTPSTSAASTSATGANIH